MTVVIIFPPRDGDNIVAMPEGKVKPDFKSFRVFSHGVFFYPQRTCYIRCVGCKSHSAGSKIGSADIVDVWLGRRGATGAVDNTHKKHS